jgi:energy-coupling factor transporter transmembrane protein EcfT
MVLFICSLSIFTIINTYFHNIIVSGVGLVVILIIFFGLKRYGKNFWKQNGYLWIVLSAFLVSLVALGIKDLRYDKQLAVEFIKSQASSVFDENFSNYI